MTEQTDFIERKEVSFLDKFFGSIWNKFLMQFKFLIMLVFIAWIAVAAYYAA